MDNDPPRKRRWIPPKQHEKQQNESTKTICDLDDACLRTIFDFLPGHFRFVPTVNRRFRSLYHHPPNTMYMAAIASDTTREIWLEEEEANVRENGCYVAAKFGNIEALQWFHSHDCGWDCRVCVQAATDGDLRILQWARSQTPPCPWDEDKNACEAAAASGRLGVLQWLRSQTPVHVQWLLN